MARGKGKVKYRDVVGGGRTNKKTTKRKNVPRKTYSVFKNDGQKAAKKRKFLANDEEIPEKTQKPQQEVEQETSESEAEDFDQMRQLRATFSKVKHKQSFAIDSSEDSMDGNSDVNDLLEEEVKNENDLAIENVDVEEETVLESELTNDESELLDNLDDPFAKHISNDLHESVQNSLQNVPVLMQNFVQQWPTLGRLVIQIPHYKETEKKCNSVVTIEEEKNFASPASPPEIINNINLELEKLFIKSQIASNVKDANVSVQNDEVIFTNLQSELFSVINNYQDLFYSDRSYNNAEEIRFIYCLHAVNHILKTRLKIVHHNSRLSQKDDVPEEFRDQGLVRPKILIIVPFKDSALRIINTISRILLPEDKGHVMNKKRFLEEFSGNELSMPKKNPKPEDYELTFMGNTNDNFKIGITVTKKSLKLYADFYSSDIIIGSPLGLRTVVGAEGEAERDYDFLASLELLIMDQVELFYMQNWDHLIHILNHLHLQPKDSHGTDFSRVRTWSLNGWAKYYRQTLLFSSIVLPEINSIFNKRCSNHAGKVKISNVVELGSIRQVFVQLPHIFHKFEASSAEQSIEARFDFFISKVLSQQKDTLMKQTLVFISSYFDYVRLRNYFKKEDLSFVQICEYSKDNKIARARDMFYHGDAHFMLYTERYHFFNRIRVKGIRHLVFYEPPAFPHFYYEMCNLMQEGNMNRKIGSMSNMTVTVLHSKYDVHRIAAITGSERATKMLNSDRNVHMMVTGAE